MNQVCRQQLFHSHLSFFTDLPVGIIIGCSILGTIVVAILGVYAYKRITTRSPFDAVSLTNTNVLYAKASNGAGNNDTIKDYKDEDDLSIPGTTEHTLIINETTKPNTAASDPEDEDPNDDETDPGVSEHTVILGETTESSNTTSNV